jgi:uncharacterized protein (DUF58 family)
MTTAPIPRATLTRGTVSRYLDLKALATLAHMRFATRHRIEGSYSGRHRSRQQGGAGEFVDFREYSPGEDLRRLDWKVFARSGRTYTRLYQDETNLLCTLAIDASGSMRFGEQSRGGSKLQYAQFLATALSQLIVLGQDQVGVAILSDHLETLLAAGGSRSHLAQVQDAIERIETRPSVHMAASVRELFQRTSRRGVLLLVSDFLMEDLQDVFAAVRLFRHRQSEVIVLHLVHPDEERLPDGAAFRFDGMENEGTIDCSPAEIRALYEQRMAAHLAAVRTHALADGCDYRRVSTAVPYLRTLGEFLVERVG